MRKSLGLAKGAAKRLAGKYDATKHTGAPEKIQPFKPSTAALLEKASRKAPELTLAVNHMPDAWKDHNPHLIHGLKPAGIESLGSGDNLTPNVRLAANKHDPDLHVVVKPGLDGDQLGDIHSSLPNSHFGEYSTAHREAAYHRLADKFFGMGKYVPETTIFEHPETKQAHSAQRFIPNTEPFAMMSHNESKDWMDQHVGTADTQKLGIMNTLLGNNDRHRYNILAGHDNKLHMIDHGFTFDYGHRFAHLTPQYLHRDHLEGSLTPETHKWIDSLNPEDFKEHLARTGMPPKLAAIAYGRLWELQRWSKRERQRQASGQQEGSGKLGNGLQLMRLHHFNHDTGAQPDVNRMEAQRARLEDATEILPPKGK